jgi:hypothetical protein
MIWLHSIKKFLFKYYLQNTLVFLIKKKWKEKFPKLVNFKTYHPSPKSTKEAGNVNNCFFKKEN